eukprot:scaffold649_cov274-Chaetoceros_neogracile.AAC.1
MASGMLYPWHSGLNDAREVTVLGENMCSVFCGGCIAVNTCTKHFMCRGEGCKVLDWYDVGLNCSGFVVPCCVVVSRKGVRRAG